MEGTHLVWSTIKSMLGGTTSDKGGGLEHDIAGAIDQIVDPKTGVPLSKSGVLSDPQFDDGRLVITISIAGEDAQLYAPVRDALEVTLAGVDGVEQALVVLTAESPAERVVNPTTIKPTGKSTRQAPPASSRPSGRRMGGIDFSGIGAIIAVASGKGGVGKSTVTANLAVALKAQGLTVGVLDADVYGPSIPRLFAVSAPPQFDESKKANPPVGHGVKVMSMGFLIEEGTPMVWRAPMVVSALTQMLSDVNWAGQNEPLDVLLIDMPPGTGDTQLTISQQVPLDGAVIVSTPQDLALIDARKGVAMFQKVEVPILGIVENMSTFHCPQCGHESHIFGHGGARQDAARFGVPFLGEVPLHMSIRETSDAGRPIGVSEPDGPHAKVFASMAGSIWADVLARKAGKRQPPVIIIEDELS
jgi:ATP-binding protein involved in chromosome partitioning